MSRSVLSQNEVVSAVAARALPWRSRQATPAAQAVADTAARAAASRGSQRWHARIEEQRVFIIVEFLACWVVVKL
jgi:hypothetical protein